MALLGIQKFRSGCPIATTLDLLGDRWTLVIVRDMIMGKSRFGDLLKSPEHIPTNILADRLQRMEAFGLLQKHRYREKPTRFEYHLSEKGADLLPALQAVCAWANRHLSDTWRPPRSFLEMRPDDVVARHSKIGKS